MDTRTVAELTPFLRRVRQKFKPVRFILFGSRARGEALRESDYDILIISPGFQRIPFYERHVQVYHLQREPLDIEVICLTPEEFRRRSRELSIIGEAAEHGKEIIV